MASSREPLNIVILGASFAGLSAAHNFLCKTVEQVSVTRSAVKYRVILVSPSTHLYWNIGAPRAIVSQALLPHSKTFVPFLEAFQAYPKSRFTFIHGSAIGVDFHLRTVTIAVIGDGTAPVRQANARWSHGTSNTSNTGSTDAARETAQTINYHALILATGTSAESPLLSLHGPHEDTMSHFDSFECSLGDA